MKTSTYVIIGIIFFVLLILIFGFILSSAGMSGSESITPTSTAPVITSAQYQVSGDYYTVTGQYLLWPFAVYLNDVNYSNLSKVTNTTSSGQSFNITFDVNVSLNSEIYIVLTSSNLTSNVYTITSVPSSDEDAPNITAMTISTPANNSQFQVTATNYTNINSTAPATSYINDLNFANVFWIDANTTGFMIGYSYYILPIGANYQIQTNNGLSNVFQTPTPISYPQSSGGPTITGIMVQLNNIYTYTMTGTGFTSSMTVFVNGIQLPTNISSVTSTQCTILFTSSVYISAQSNIYIKTQAGLFSNLFSFPQNKPGTLFSNAGTGIPTLTAVLINTSLSTTTATTLTVTGTNLYWPYLCYVNNINLGVIVTYESSGTGFNALYNGIIINNGATFFVMTASGTSLVSTITV